MYITLRSPHSHERLLVQMLVILCLKDDGTSEANQPRGKRRQKPQELDHGKRKKTQVDFKTKSFCLLVSAPPISDSAPCWTGRGGAIRRRGDSLGSSPYCPDALAALCCSNMARSAGDIMAGDIGGVKGRSGYCVFLPGT